MSRRRTRPSPPLRWIDLGIDWFRQYGLTDCPADPPPRALDEITGYLDATSAAFVTVDADPPADLGPRARLAALHDRITRAEAEFCGRLLVSGSDLGRWLDDPASLTWAVLCLDQPPTDATEEEIASLVGRGVRIWTLDPGASLAAQLDRRVLASDDGPRLGLDLARLAEPEIQAVLGRLESTADQPGRALPLLREAPAAAIAQLSDETLGRLARAGGVIGVALKGAPITETRAALERLVAVGGAEGTGPRAALASGFLTGPPAPTGLATAPQLIDTLHDWFDPATARGLLRAQAEEFLARLIGPPVHPSAAERPPEGAADWSRDVRPAY